MDNKTRIMDIELREILNKVYRQEMRPDEAQWKICALFNVVGQSEQFYCGFEGDDYNKNCDNQCDECKHIERL